MFGNFKSIVRKRNPAGVSIYKGAEFSLTDIREYLLQFSGGSVKLRLENETGIAKICLSHPEKKNSITGKMMVELEYAVEELEKWKNGKGVLIFGKENNFCSGGDLNFAEKTGSDEGGYKMATFMQNVLQRLQQLPMVSVAFVEGFALGGGAELAISCDFRVFLKDNSAIGFVHSKMGIIPAWGGMSTAIQTLGYRTALELVTSGRVVQATEAERLGLCDAQVENIDGALLWLAQHTKCDVSVIRAAKSVAYNCKNSGPHEDTLDYEKKVFSPLWGGPVNKLALSQKLKHKQ